MHKILIKYHRPYLTCLCSAEAICRNAGCWMMQPVRSVAMGTKMPTIIFSCPFASEFWSAIGFVVPADAADVSHLDKLDRPAHIPSKHFSTLLLLCCWQLWKRRNGVIFRQEEATKQETLRLAREDARLWQGRLPRKDACVADSWGAIFSLAM